MNFSVTDSSPSCIDYRNKSNYGAMGMAKGQDSGFNFTRELRIIQEISRATKEVPWLTLNHLQVLLHILDMDTPEGLEAQTLAKVTGHNKSTVNRIVHSLGEGGGRGSASKEGLGIIEMHTDQQDRRIRRIHLTAYGQRLKQLLLNAGSSNDPEAGMLEREMQGHMFQSSSRVLEAEAGNHALTGNDINMQATIVAKAAMKVGAEVIKNTTGVAAEGQVGSVNVETNGPETLYPQGMQQLERALRYAAKNNVDHVSFRGRDVPLIEREVAMAKVADGKLFRHNSVGAWIYHTDVVAEDFANVPAFVQADMQPDELDKYIEQQIAEIVFGDERVDVTLDRIGKDLNNTQRKYAVDAVVKGLGRVRTEKAEEAEKRTKYAKLKEDQAWRLGKEAHHFARQSWNTDDEEAADMNMVKANMLTTEMRRQEAEAEQAHEDADFAKYEADKIANIAEEAAAAAVRKYLEDKG